MKDQKSKKKRHESRTSSSSRSERRKKKKVESQNLLEQIIENSKGPSTLRTYKFVDKTSSIDDPVKTLKYFLSIQQNLQFPNFGILAFNKNRPVIQTIPQFGVFPSPIAAPLASASPAETYIQNPDYKPGKTHKEYVPRYIKKPEAQTVVQQQEKQVENVKENVGNLIVFANNVPESCHGWNWMINQVQIEVEKSNSEFLVLLLQQILQKFDRGTPLEIIEQFIDLDKYDIKFQQSYFKFHQTKEGDQLYKEILKSINDN